MMVSSAVGVQNNSSTTLTAGRLAARLHLSYPNFWKGTGCSIYFHNMIGSRKFLLCWVMRMGFHIVKGVENCVIDDGI